MAKRHGICTNPIDGWTQVLDSEVSLFARGASALGDGEEDMSARRRSLIPAS